MPPADTQSDVVFREGQTLGGHITHTPRLIIMDLKGDIFYKICLDISTFLYLCLVFSLT